MSSLQYIHKIARPEQCVTAALAAFAVALLSNGPLWFTIPKIAAPISIALSVLGSSLLHYGMCADIYAKKHWDPVYVKNPRRLRRIGWCSFFASIGIAIIFLPETCILIAVMNAVLIYFYGKELDQYWPWKNLVIAVVCTTPLLIGWSSGHRLHPIVLPMIASTFFVYLAREILKDIQDRVANHGSRFTMVMDLGVPASLRVAGVILSIAAFVLLAAWQYVPSSLVFAIIAYWMSVAVLIWNAVTLLRAIDITSHYRRIDIAVLSFLVCMLIIRAHAH
jgi:4-hydroxybenzoate polyprenyltransferase